MNFDADLAIQRAAELGLTLDPWQVRVLRDIAAGQTVTHPVLGLGPTIQRLIIEQQGSTGIQAR